MKLLIADDNESTRRLIRHLMRGIAREVFEARDGKEAVALFSEHRPEWVLMDVEMAGMDGISAVKSIRATDPEAKVIIVTMYDDDRLRAEARSAGATGYLLKENLIELPSMIRRPPPGSKAGGTGEEGDAGERR
jgi:CheY-like chemotaxis protein